MAHEKLIFCKRDELVYVLLLPRGENIFPPSGVLSPWYSSLPEKELWTTPNTSSYHTLDLEQQKSKKDRLRKLIRLHLVLQIMNLTHHLPVVRYNMQSLLIHQTNQFFQESNTVKSDDKRGGSMTTLHALVTCHVHQLIPVTKNWFSAWDFIGAPELASHVIHES